MGCFLFFALRPGWKYRKIFWRISCRSLSGFFFFGDGEVVMASFLVLTHGFLSLEMSSGVALLLFINLSGARGDVIHCDGGKFCFQQKVGIIFSDSVRRGTWRTLTEFKFLCNFRWWTILRWPQHWRLLEGLESLQTFHSVTTFQQFNSSLTTFEIRIATAEWLYTPVFTCKSPACDHRWRDRMIWQPNCCPSWKELLMKTTSVKKLGYWWLPRNGCYGYACLCCSGCTFSSSQQVQWLLLRNFGWHCW